MAATIWRRLTGKGRLTGLPSRSMEGGSIRCHPMNGAMRQMMCGRLCSSLALLLLGVAPALVARAEPPPAAARSFVMSPLSISLDDEKPGDSSRQPEMWPADPLPERARRPSWEARPFWENFSVLGGLDGAKGPEDLGISANFGYRVAVQTAGPLVAEWGLGVQIGTG